RPPHAFETWGFARPCNLRAQEFGDAIFILTLHILVQVQFFRLFRPFAHFCPRSAGLYIRRCCGQSPPGEYVRDALQGIASTARKSQCRNSRSWALDRETPPRPYSNKY